MSRVSYEDLQRIVPDTHLCGSFGDITLRNNGNDMKNLSEILYLTIYHTRDKLFKEEGNRAFELIFHSEDKDLTLRTLMEINDLLCMHGTFDGVELIAHTHQQNPTKKYPFRAITFLCFIKGKQLIDYASDNKLLFTYDFDNEENNLIPRN